MSDNPLLERVKLPGQTFQLPSKGLFYKNGELKDTVQNGEVYVSPMSALDEMTMRSPDKLLSGKAIIEIFGNCIPDIVKPNDMLQKDVDYLITCLKKISYGSETDISFTHDCENAKKHHYVINLESFIKSTKQIDPTTIQSVYTVALDNGQVVLLHPIRYVDVIELATLATQDDVTQEQEQEQTFKTLVNLIESVDGITDKVLIAEWIRKIPAGYARKVSECIENTSNWGPEFIMEVACKDCGENVKLENELNPITFFLT